MAKKTAEELAQARAEFQKLCALAQEDEAAALFQIGKFSLAGYGKVMAAMEAQGLTGIPYVHVATFDEWINRGYCVQKGQKSFCSVVTFVTMTNKQGEEYKRPWSSYLFHFSQVREL